MGEPGLDQVDRDAIARAEKAIEELSVEFDGWMHEEVTRLLETRAVVKREGLVAPHADELFRAAHDLKGQADTLGYPLVTLLCTSLCRLLEATEERDRIPMSLIDNHVDAVHIVIRDKIKTDNHHTTLAVIDRLGEVVEDLESHFARQKAD